MAGHDSCDLRRHLDSVVSETPIRDIVDRCRVWESHTDSDARRFSRPGPERALPVCTVDDPGCGRDDRMVAVVTTLLTAPDQLELRWLLPTPVAPAPPPKPVPSAVEQLLQPLLVGTQALEPVPPVKTGITDIETLLQSLLPRVLTSALPALPGLMRRGWTAVVCFSCGKAGHGATRCPELNETFPFMLPGCVVLMDARTFAGEVAVVVASPADLAEVVAVDVTSSPESGTRLQVPDFASDFDSGPGRPSLESEGIL